MIARHEDCPDRGKFVLTMASEFSGGMVTMYPGANMSVIPIVRERR